MTAATVQARTYCAGCDRYGPWFPVEEHRATLVLAAKAEQHRKTCPHRHPEPARRESSS